MTIQTHDFIGHKMLLIADGGVLTQCKWISPEADSIMSSTSTQDDGVIDLAVTQISEYLAGKRKEFSIPMCLKGSDFRMKVWDEMRKIPYGETVSYKELAQRIGSPAACRAVANACGANPFPIIIPCHRVVASGGKSGGYTGGLEIKLTLLALENQNTDNFVV